MSSQFYYFSAKGFDFKLITFICGKVYVSLCLIKRAIPEVSITKTLYISLVRSIAYCSQCLSKGIYILENVQRRATKYILNGYNIFALALWLQFQYTLSYILFGKDG